MEAAETTSRKKLTPRYGRFVTRLRGNPAAVHEWRYGITPCSSRATVVGSNQRSRVGKHANTRSWFRACTPWCSTTCRNSLLFCPALLADSLCFRANLLRLITRKHASTACVSSCFSACPHTRSSKKLPLQIRVSVLACSRACTHTGSQKCTRRSLMTARAKRSNHLHSAFRSCSCVAISESD